VHEDNKFLFATGYRQHQIRLIQLVSKHLGILSLRELYWQYQLADFLIPAADLVSGFGKIENRQIT